MARARRSRRIVGSILTPPVRSPSDNRRARAGARSCTGVVGRVSAAPGEAHDRCDLLRDALPAHSRNGGPRQRTLADERPRDHSRTLPAGGPFRAPRTIRCACERHAAAGHLKIDSYRRPAEQMFSDKCDPRLPPRNVDDPIATDRLVVDSHGEIAPTVRELRPRAAAEPLSDRATRRLKPSARGISPRAHTARASTPASPGPRRPRSSTDSRDASR